MNIIPYDKSRERAKELYRLNREERIKKVREYRIKNAEVIKIKKRISYLNDRERILLKQKDYYAKHAKEVALKGKVYRKENKETILIRNRNRKNLLRTLSKKGDVDNTYLKKILEESTQCPLCGNGYKSNSDKHIDHINPVGKGGEHKKENVRVICKRCNLTRPKDGRDNIKKP